MAGPVRITLTHNAPQVAAAIARADTAVLGEISKTLGRAAVQISRTARDKAPKADTLLANSIQPVRISLLEHHVRAAQDYASFQEFGSGPGGRPSLARTLAWIRRKGIAARTPGMGETELAHLIRRKIARTGVPAQPFMAPALREHAPALDGLFRAAVARGLAAVESGRAL